MFVLCTQEKHATVVIGMVDGFDTMKKERDEAVKGLAAAVKEAAMYKACLEGKFGLPGSESGAAGTKKAQKSSAQSSASSSSSKHCPLCTKHFTSKIEALKKTHADEVAKLQQSVKQWTAKFDGRLEAKTYSHRFRERENELRLCIETLERDLTKARTELREKRACFDTHMVATLKHKAVAKELAAVKELFAQAAARVAELEKSVMQVDDLWRNLLNKCILHGLPECCSLPFRTLSSQISRKSTTPRSSVPNGRTRCPVHRHCSSRLSWTLSSLGRGSVRSMKKISFSPTARFAPSTTVTLGARRRPGDRKEGTLPVAAVIGWMGSRKGSLNE
jgi:ribosomal protein L44E